MILFIKHLRPAGRDPPAGTETEAEKETTGTETTETTTPAIPKPTRPGIFIGRAAAASFSSL